MHRLPTTPFSLFAALFFAATLARGELIFHSNFAHGASDILGSAASSGFPNGTGWESGSGNVRYESSVTAPWAGDTDYILVPSGNNAGGSMFSASLSSNGRRGMQKDLGTSLTGTFWLSALLRSEVNLTTVGTFLAFENGAASFSAVDGQGFGLRGDGQLITTSGGASGVTAQTANFDFNVWYLFVAKIALNATPGGADSLDLWVFDNASSFGLTEASLGTAALSTSSIQFGDSIGDVWFGTYMGNTQAGGSLDNLRISNLGTDSGVYEVLQGAVIPEPGTLALVGLSLAASVLFRRRR